MSDGHSLVIQPPKYYWQTKQLVHKAIFVVYVLKPLKNNIEWYDYLNMATYTTSHPHMLVSNSPIC